MYKTYRLDKSMCRFAAKYFDLIDENCDVIELSIWNVVPKERVRDIFFKGSWLESTNWFSLLYWWVFCLATLGVLHSFYVLVSVSWNSLLVWRDRKLRYVTSDAMRAGRLVGVFLLLWPQVMLWYAVVTVTPHCMRPWMRSTIAMMVLEAIIWMAELFFRKSKPKITILIGFLLPFVNLYFVHCVRGVYETALEKNYNLDNLRLFNWLSTYYNGEYGN